MWPNSSPMSWQPPSANPWSKPKRLQTTGNSSTKQPARLTTAATAQTQRLAALSFLGFLGFLGHGQCDGLAHLGGQLQPALGGGLQGGQAACGQKLHALRRTLPHIR